jgi:NTE family protein
LDWNPLRWLLEKIVDFDAIRRSTQFPIVVCATNLLTARRRTFCNAEISPDAIMASACLPTVLRGVEINAEPYWDGAFTGNPAILRLLPQLPDCDLLIVRNESIVRSERPRTIDEAWSRQVEMGMNTTLWLELSVVGVVKSLADLGVFDRKRIDRIRFHLMRGPHNLRELAHHGELGNSDNLLETLFELGRSSAEAWLTENRSCLGKRSSYDLRQLLPPGTEEFLEQRVAQESGKSRRSVPEL